MFFDAPSFNDIIHQIAKSTIINALYPILLHLAHTKFPDFEYFSDQCLASISHSSQRAPTCPSLHTSSPT